MTVAVRRASPAPAAAAGGAGVGAAAAAAADDDDADAEPEDVTNHQPPARNPLVTYFGTAAPALDIVDGLYHTAIVTVMQFPV